MACGSAMVRALALGAACSSAAIGMGAGNGPAGRPADRDAVAHREEDLTLPWHEMVVVGELPPGKPGGPSRVKREEQRKGDRTFRCVFLEDEFLRVRVIPELGGQVHDATFLPTGDDVFYCEQVAKPYFSFLQSGVRLSFPKAEHGMWYFGQPASYRVVSEVEEQPHNWEARLLQAWVQAMRPLKGNGAVALAEAMAEEDPADSRVQYTLWRGATRLEQPGTAEAAKSALDALLEGPDAQRRLDEFVAATRGEYLPPRRMPPPKPRTPPPPDRVPLLDLKQSAPKVSLGNCRFELYLPDLVPIKHPRWGTRFVQGRLNLERIDGRWSAATCWPAGALPRDQHLKKVVCAGLTIAEGKAHGTVRVEH
jgi:hypothetical protein